MVARPPLPPGGTPDVDSVALTMHAWIKTATRGEMSSEMSDLLKYLWKLRAEPPPGMLWGGILEIWDLGDSGKLWF